MTYALSDNKTRTRVATKKDLPLLLPIAFDFIKDLKHPSNIEIDKESVEGTLKHLISDDNSTIILSENGLIGGMVFPYFFNTNVMTAQELFWWVDDEARGSSEGTDLLEAFNVWAKEKGASSLTMVHLENDNSSKMENFYISQGYSPVETSYVRAI